MRWVRRCFLVAIALAAVTVAWQLSRNRVMVTNETGQPILALTIEVCGQTIAFGDVSPGGSVLARFGTSADEDHFTVRGRLADGTVIDDTCGYIVWEDYGSRFQIVIRPGGIVEELSDRSTE
jgi:hypothetical protein